MNFDITKYLKNKDITISNDDLDISAMEKTFIKAIQRIAIFLSLIIQDM